MKKTLLGLLLCTMVSVAVAQKAPILVTVDVNKALAGYQRLQDAQVKFDASVNTTREELEAEAQKLRSAAEELNDLQKQTENPALNDSKLKEIEENIRTKLDAYRQQEGDFGQLRQRAERTLAERRNNILSLYLEEVKDAIKKVCKNRGATLALNLDGNVVLHADASFDITQDVLLELNKVAAAQQ
jgi:Skp family chaperone for outer membrane proteins